MIERYRTVLPRLKLIDQDACAEYRFHPVRKWRADFCMPKYHILIEIDGGTWSGGRHTQGVGFQKDQEKTNAAAICGFWVLRFIPSDINKPIFMDTIKGLIAKIESQ